MVVGSIGSLITNVNNELTGTLVALLVGVIANTVGLTVSMVLPVVYLNSYVSAIGLPARSRTPLTRITYSV